MNSAYSSWDSILSKIKLLLGWYIFIALLSIAVIWLSLHNARNVLTYKFDPHSTKKAKISMQVLVAYFGLFFTSLILGIKAIMNMTDEFVLVEGLYVFVITLGSIIMVLLVWWYTSFHRLHSYSVRKYQQK